MGPRLQTISSENFVLGTPQLKLIEDLHRLSESSEHTGDLVFLMGDEDAIEKIYAHKVIMQARCKSFQTTKRSEISKIPGSTVSISSNLISIRLPHISADIFRQFIVYVYTAKIILQDSKVFEMMACAQDLGVIELRDACEEYVLSTLSVENAFLFLEASLEISNKLSSSAFIEKCSNFIEENALECVKSNAFLNISKETLIKVISSDDFAMDEADVFRSVLKWAKHKAGVTQPLAHWTVEERQRVCQQLTPIMSYIRLLLIDSKVFAEEVEPTGAVPMEFVLERYRHAALNATKSPGSYNVSALALDGKRLRSRCSINFFHGSTILKNDKLQLQISLNEWFGTQKQNWQLLYKASSNNFSASLFHKICDGIAPLYIVVLGADNTVCGGFTDVAFSKSGRKGYIFSENAFLFNYKNEKNQPPKKYELIKKLYAICYHISCGPIFGAGADLFISDKCNINADSYSNLGHTYNAIEGTNSLFKQYNTVIQDYEVFTIENNEM
uniref:CSON005639 protein n=1 Tax=Culicoides sonorensis TaxID=179676 RepID=A0A336LJ79_CULSO